DEVERAITPATRMLFVETPTNPVMRLTDLRAAADLAHRRNVRLVVDNTFASPYIQRPIELGADLVTHSTTKYLNGHSDSVGGIGGMLAFELGSFEAARRLLNSVRLHALAESLGGVETLISHPATMTHASVPPETRARIGITDGLVRISAGIEDIDDLKEDLA